MEWRLPLGEPHAARRADGLPVGVAGGVAIGGDCDPLVPLSWEKEVERGVPGARRIEIGTCGHYPQYTHPAAMAEAIAEFLK